MKNLRIALGYKTGHRNSEPSILAAGFEKGALQSAVDSAPAEFLRFEFGTFLFGQRARRSLGVSAPEPADDFPIKGPTAEDALAMLEEIENLRALLRKEREEGSALLSGADREIERLRVTANDAGSLAERLNTAVADIAAMKTDHQAALAEIARLKAELAAPVQPPPPVVEAAPPVTETPAAGTAPAESAAERSAEDSDPSSLPPGTGRKKRN